MTKNHVGFARADSNPAEHAILGSCSSLMAGDWPLELRRVGSRAEHLRNDTLHPISMPHSHDHVMIVRIEPRFVRLQIRSHL